MPGKNTVVVKLAKAPKVEAPKAEAPKAPEAPKVEAVKVETPKATAEELMLRLRDASTTRSQRKQIRAMLRRRGVALSKMTDEQANRKPRAIIASEAK